MSRRTHTCVGVSEPQDSKAQLAQHHRETRFFVIRLKEQQRSSETTTTTEATLPEDRAFWFPTQEAGARVGRSGLELVPVGDGVTAAGPAGKWTRLVRTYQVSVDLPCVCRVPGQIWESEAQR